MKGLKASDRKQGAVDFYGLELGIGRCKRLFEYCAGPGYIGVGLLASGFCERLALSDVNPVTIEAAKKTAKLNGLEDRVEIYLSCGLSKIPDLAPWGLVVANPPHFLPKDSSDRDIRGFDSDWNIHRDFYSQIRRHMAPGGRVVMMENCAGSSRKDFKPMIAAGEGDVT